MAIVSIHLLTANESKHIRECLHRRESRDQRNLLETMIILLR